MAAELEARLRSVLGMNKYQAAAYVALLRGGPMRAQEVAKAAGIPQQRVYDTLRSLIDMGLVAEREGTFEVVNPVDALQVIAKREVARALGKAEEIERLSRELAASFGQGQGSPQVSILRGLDLVLGAALAGLSRCDERPIFMTSRVFERLGQLLPVLRELAKASGRGGVVIVPRGYLERYAQHVREFEGLGLKFVESEASFLDLMVACDTVIIGVPYLSDAVGVVIRDRGFAEGLRKGVEKAIGL